MEPPVQPVNGTVTDTEGDPVAGTEVTVTDADGEEVATATTDDDGVWTADLVDAEYTATVNPPDGYVVDREASLPFEVVGGEVTGLDFVLAVEDVTPGPTPGDASGVGPGASSAGSGGVGSLPVTGATVGSVALGALLLATFGTLLVRSSRRAASGGDEA